MTTPPAILQALPDLTESLPQRAIAGFWRRFAASMFDVLLLAVAFSMAASLFFDQLSRVGVWGPFIGFCLAMPYFVIFNSRAGKGQTPGKRVMRVRVVDSQGEPISLANSLLRYSVLCIPFLLNDLQLPYSRTPVAVMWLCSFIIFGAGVPTLYLVLCNRATRQGLHDLAAGSYVVSADDTGTVKLSSSWPGHWVILATLLAIMVIGGVFLQRKALSFFDFPALTENIRAIESMDGVQAASIMDQTQWSSGGKRTAYIVTVYWSGSARQNELLANAVAAEILARDPHILQRDRLLVSIVRGYSLGFVWARVLYPFSDTPAGWQLKLGGHPVPAPYAD